MIDLYKVLVRPLITEKSNYVSDKYGHVVFRVSPDATKSSIKQSFELLCKAKVKNVRIVSMRGKVKRFKGHIGKRVNWKKAYISLVDGQNFDLASS